MCFICKIIQQPTSSFEPQPFNISQLHDKVRSRIDKNIEYVLGNDVSFEDVEEAIDYLMERDYKGVRKIVIPSRYITKIPHVISRDPKDLENQIRKVDQEGENTQKWKPRRDNLKGDNVEHNLYDALVDFYKDSDDVLILHDYEVLCFEHCNKQKMEKDILIVDGNYKFIMNIEAKASLRQKTVHDAKKQLDNMKELAQKWLGNVIKPNWVFISALYSDEKPEDPKNKSPNTINYQECDPDFVFTGSEDLKKKMKRFRVKRQQKSMSTLERIMEYCVLPSKDESFDQIVKHLIYFSTATPAPTSTTIFEKESKSIDKSGSSETVAFWNWNPKQKNLLSSDYKRVIFDSGFGTGKTGMMVAKAKMVAKQRPNDSVAYIIDGEINRGVSLLECWMESEFENFPNVTVLRANLASIENLENSHCFIDEVFVGTSDSYGCLDQILESFDQRPDLYLWITIGYMIISTRLSFSGYTRPGYVPQGYKEWMETLRRNHGVQNPDLQYVLRNSTKIAELVGGMKLNTAVKGSGLCIRPKKFPDFNMITGDAIKLNVSDVRSLVKAMKCHLPSFGILFVNDLNAPEKEQVVRLNKELEYILTENGRKVVLGTSEDIVHSWLQTNTKRKADLLVMHGQVQGFEWPFVVLLTRNWTRKGHKVDNLVMRAKSKIVVINFSRSLYGELVPEEYIGFHIQYLMLLCFPFQLIYFIYRTIIHILDTIVTRIYLKFFMTPVLMKNDT